MTKILTIIHQLELADQLLSMQVQAEHTRLTHQYNSQLLRVHQKVSLAEMQMQVKNTCSPISSEI